MNTASADPPHLPLSRFRAAIAWGVVPVCLALVVSLGRNMGWLPLPRGVEIGAYALVILVHMWLSGVARDLRVGAVLAVIATTGFIANAAGGEPIVVLLALALTLAVFYFLLNTAGVAVALKLGDRQEQREFREKSRHEKIARVLALREELGASPYPRVTRPEEERNYDHVLRFIPGVMFFLGLVLEVALRRYDPQRTFLSNQGNGADIGAVAALTMIIGIVSYAGYFLIGYLSRRFWATMKWTALAFIASGLAVFLQIYTPLEMIRDPRYTQNLAVGLVFSVLIALAGLIASESQKRLRRQFQRQNRDPRVMQEELTVLLESLGEVQRVAVLSVDVAGSTRMKEGQDPLVVEWCFGEYQRLVAEVTLQFGGRVESTAGDGAILSFGQAEDAIAAAAEMLRTIAQFNETRNRLPSPFAVRIGAHIGESRGALEQVQYTDLIDHAAHIEANTPTGCVGLSEAMRAALPHLEGEPLGSSVDNRSVTILSASVLQKA